MLLLHYLIKTLILIFVMYLEAKETARLYKLHNKTERSVEATIKTLATKDDLAKVRDEIAKSSSYLRDEIAKSSANLEEKVANVRYDLSKEIGNSVKWMFIFWIGQLGAMLAITFLFLKK